MKTRSKNSKLVMNALLLAIGVILHQITPAIGLPMQPDFALAMMLIIVILNPKDYKTALISGIITGVFTAMTTKFPGGQIPNIVDKMITVNLMYGMVHILYSVGILKRIVKRHQEILLALIVLPIGTLVSGTVFLYSAKVMVGLPVGFMILLITIVIPTTIINGVAGVFLMKLIQSTMLRLGISEEGTVMENEKGGKDHQKNKRKSRRNPSEYI